MFVKWIKKIIRKIFDRLGILEEYRKIRYLLKLRK